MIDLMQESTSTCFHDMPRVRSEMIDLNQVDLMENHRKDRDVMSSNRINNKKSFHLKNDKKNKWKEIDRADDTDTDSQDLKFVRKFVVTDAHSSTGNKQGGYLSHRDLEMDCMALKLELANTQTDNDYLMQAHRRLEENHSKLKKQLQEAKEYISQIDTLSETMFHLQNNAKKSALERTELRVRLESLQEQRDRYKEQNNQLQQEYFQLKLEKQEYIKVIIDMRVEMERLKKRRVVNQEENEPLCLKQNDDKVLNASSKSWPIDFHSKDPDDQCLKCHQYPTNEMACSICFAKNHEVPSGSICSLSQSHHSSSSDNDCPSFTEGNVGRALRRWSLVTFGRPLSYVDLYLDEKNSDSPDPIPMQSQINHDSAKSQNIQCQNQETRHEYERDSLNNNINIEESDQEFIFSSRILKMLPSRMRRKHSLQVMIGSQAGDEERQNDFRHLRRSFPSKQNLERRGSDLIHKFQNNLSQRMMFPTKKTSAKEQSTSSEHNRGLEVDFPT